MSFNILDMGPPEYFEGHPETPWSDGEQERIEWELYALEGDREGSYEVGETIRWRAEFDHPLEPHRKIPVVCEFLIDCIGSEGSMFGWGVADWRGDIPLSRRQRNDLYL